MELREAIHIVNMEMTLQPGDRLTKREAEAVERVLRAAIDMNNISEALANNLPSD